MFLHGENDHLHRIHQDITGKMASCEVSLRRREWLGTSD